MKRTPPGLPRALAMLALLAAPAASPSPAAGAPAVAQVDGPRIRLSEILAALRPGMDPATAAEAEDADLGAAPPPGTRRRFESFQLLAVLARAGVQLPRSVPRSLLVETRARTLGEDELLGSAAAQLAARGALRPGSQLRLVEAPRRIAIPRGELDLAARLAPSGRPGRALLSLVLTVGSWAPRTVVLPVRLEGKTPVLVFAGVLEAGAPVAPGSVRLEMRSVEEIPADALFSEEEAAGKRLAARVAGGTVVRRGVLASIPLVHRGAAVLLTATRDGVRVSMRGVAREDGALGEEVMVLAATGRTVRATVVGPRELSVDL
jgi:flagella basal body P-ring formation protein FlgA